MFKPILRSPIPTGGFGRPLTSTEARDLGVSRKCIVLRYADSPSRGIVYRPSPGGGFDKTSRKVETK